jgi:predicted nucleic acid-binding protein
MILLDINVVLDVVQRREPHYRASAAVLDLVVRKKVAGALSAHAVTTIHFIVSRYQRRETASRVVDWLLGRFTIAGVGKSELIRAQSLGWEDFEDAVVAAAAESSGCDAIVTRNVRDFRATPVRAVTPEEYLLDFENASRG